MGIPTQDGAARDYFNAYAAKVALDPGKYSLSSADSAAISAAASTRLVPGSGRRPTADANPVAATISAARTADGGAPTSRVYVPTTRPAARSAHNLGMSRPATPSTAPPISATLKPETARMWLVPVARSCERSS